MYNNIMEQTKYYYKLKSMIRKIIFNDLTIGRLDNGLDVFQDKDINDFIKFNDENIEKTISAIIDVYKQDNELELLENPEHDWITEYLYDFVEYDKLC